MDLRMEKICVQVSDCHDLDMTEEEPIALEQYLSMYCIQFIQELRSLDKGKSPLSKHTIIEIVYTLKVRN